MSNGSDQQGTYSVANSQPLKYTQYTDVTQ